MSRRRFIEKSAGVFAAGLWPPARALAAQVAAASAAAHGPQSGHRPRRPVVVEARSEHVVINARVREDVLDEMMREALPLLVGADSSAAAWRALFGPRDVIGLRFERQGDDVLNTAAPVARWLVRGLLDAGHDPRRLVVLDGPDELPEQFGVQRARFGWCEETVDFGSGRDQVAAFLDQVDGVINVPLLKDDNITGLSGCLKGATYHLLKHPARYHAGGGAPFLGDVLAAPILQSRLRLHVLNALRTVYDRGPLVYPECVHDSGAVILSRDPLAADVVGLHLLNAVRAAHGVDPIPEDARGVPSLVSAGARGLGQTDLRRIDKRMVVTP